MLPIAIRTPGNACRCNEKDFRGGQACKGLHIFKGQSALAHQQQNGHRLPAHSVPVCNESACEQEDGQEDRQQQRGVNVLQAMISRRLDGAAACA